MTKPSLSVVISAYNNESLVENCLESITALADEIIVVDNGSTDKTVAIAKRVGAKIITHHNNPLVLNQAKNHGFSQAKSEWILSLDPDERVSKKLAHEIASAIKHPTGPVAYQMPRKNIIF